MSSMKSMIRLRYYLFVPLLSLLVVIQTIYFDLEIFRMCCNSWTGLEFLATNVESQAIPEIATAGEDAISVVFGQVSRNSNSTKTNRNVSSSLVQHGPSTFRYNMSNSHNLTNSENITTEISNKRKSPLEFVHIPKTGGSAIELAGAKAGVMWGLCHFQERPEVGCVGKDWKQYNAAKNNLDYRKVGHSWEIWHTPPSWLKKNSPYQNKTLFAVVRNPYTRFISEYYCPYNGLNPVDWDALDRDYHDPMGKPPSVKNAAKAKRVNRKKKPYTRLTLNQFIMERLKYFVKWTAHYIPQADFVFDEHGNQVIQHVLRFENISEEFQELMQTYNLPVYLNETTNESNAKKSKRFTIEDLYPGTIARINQVAERDFRLLGYEMLDPRLFRRNKRKSSKQIQTSPSIAFLFLAKNGLNDDLWARWFPSNDSRYSIFVHTRPSNTTVPLGPFLCRYAIPSVETEWFELHDGMMQLLQHAIEHDPNARSFVFVSSTSVPLVSFQNFYENLMRDSDKSRVCWHTLEGARHVWSATVRQLKIDEQMVRKAEMWSILSRQHVEQILRERQMLHQWNNLFLETRRKILANETADKSVVGAPDECFIPTFLTLKGAELVDCPLQRNQQPGSPNCCSTYVHWQRTQTNISVEKGESLLSDYCNNNGWPCAFTSLREEGLLALQERGYLMLRKVPFNATVLTSANATVPINEALLQLHAGKPISDQPRQDKRRKKPFVCAAPKS